MTQIEQIKAEIERRIDELDKDPYYGYTLARDECIKMLRFIESLEVEKPEHTIEHEVRLLPVVASNAGPTTFSIEVELSPSEIIRLAMSKTIKLMIK